MENRKIWKTSATPTPTLHHGTCSKSHKFEQQRALGFPSLKIASEKQRASGYREVRERRRVQLLRDIEAANQRKLAQDPTFEPPPPLPDLPDRASANPRLGYQVCPRPGCHARCKNEATMKIHIRKMHEGGYSGETPHKCKFASCNNFYESAQKAHRHFQKVHEAPKVRCPWCDRELSSKYNLNRHLRQVHLQT
jgi:hypothetical protein